MKRISAIILCLILLVLPFSVGAAAANYTYDLEESSSYWPWYVSADKKWCWLGSDATDWLIGYEVGGDILVDTNKTQLLELTTAQAATGNQSVLIKSNGGTSGFINLYPMIYKAGGNGVLPGNVTIKYKIFVPENSVLNNYQQKYIDGSWTWTNDNNPDTFQFNSSEHDKGVWIDWSAKIGPENGGSIISFMMQFSTESGASYGDPLFYIDSIQVIDDATGKVYKADGSFFEDEEGPLTFDAGIAVYSVLGLAGVAGSLSVMAKRKK